MLPSFALPNQAYGLWLTPLAPAKAINEPKKTAYGAPDFLIQRGNVPVGRVEAKDVGLNLDRFISDSENAKPRTSEGQQLKRYRANLSNLLYTDGLDWHWFVNGDLRTEQFVRLASPNFSRSTFPVCRLPVTGRSLPHWSQRGPT